MSSILTPAVRPARTRGNTASPSPKSRIRCAIYTRKSTEEGLDQEFNSLDAQRESGEAYVRSLTGEGWECLLVRYDDGGFTGGNMDRPALARLMADIEIGQVDCVVVYKVDRLSRSLLDFAQMMGVFDKHQVAFVSVTQQFNTATSMGRLILNVLLSFAQFEREIISERTRDKIAATRRKGKWSGGRAVLGYDVDRNGPKLVVNAVEAQQVREIYQLYLEHASLLPVVEELAQRGWTNKRAITRQGQVRGGKPFTRSSLYSLLTNVTYRGQLRYKAEVHPGQHDAIVPPELWQRVEAVLQRDSQQRMALTRGRHGAVLKGLLRCAACQCALFPTYSQGLGRRYRYYVCSSAQKRGRKTCPTRSIPAGQIERFVIDQVEQAGALPISRAAWDALVPIRQADLLHSIVEGINYDGATGQLNILLFPRETESLSLEQKNTHEDPT